MQTRWAIAMAFLLGGAAAPGFTPQPPYSSSLPTVEQAERARVKGTSPVDEAEQERIQPSSEIKGRIVTMNPADRRMALATDTGVREIAIPDHATVVVAGRRISSLYELPREGAYRLTVQGLGTGPTIYLQPINEPAGPDVLPPVHPNDRIGP